MADEDTNSIVIARITEEFIDRYRNGDHPLISEYTDKYAAIAEEVRECLDAVVLVEGLAAKGRDANSHVSKSLTPLTNVGDYRILRELGRGGMGVVYEAEQISLERHVALKILPFHVAKDERSLARFRREARTAAKMHHSNIVPVFEVGEADEIRFLAMQFIDGLSLDVVLEELRRLRRETFGNVPPNQHGMNVVHNMETPSRNPHSPDSAKSCESKRAIARSLVSGEFLIENANLLEESASSSSVRIAGIVNREVVESRDASLRVRQTEMVELEAIGNRTATLSSSSLNSVLGTSDSSVQTNTISILYYQNVARLGIQIAEALAYAHERGVIHRDIKPSNLLLDLAGTVWVTDFGLAKDNDDGLTKTGDIVGTIRYMAPERFQGKADALSDIYSLGVTLYEMATLRPAYPETDHLQLMLNVTRADPVPPRKNDKRIPADLETVILKTIHRERERRYQTGRELADDLRCIIENRPIRARRVAWSEHTWRWCRRNPIASALLSLSLILLVTIAVGTSLYSTRLADQLTVLNRANKEKDSALRNETEAHRKTDAALFESYLSEAKSNRISRRVGQRFKALESIQKALELGKRLGITDDQRSALRNEAIAAMALPDIRVAESRGNWPMENLQFDFDPSLRRYARIGLNGELSVFRFEDDVEEFNLPDFAKDETYIGFSNKGRYLAAWSQGGRLRVLDFGVNPPLLRLNIEGGAGNYPGFSSDETMFAYGASDGMITVVELPEGNVVHRINAGPSPNCISFRPNLRQLAATISESVIRIFDIDTEAVVTELPQPAYRLAWHPDGRRIAAATRELKIHIWDAQTGAPSWVLEGIRNNGIEIAFNHSGDLLVSKDWSCALRLWDLSSGLQILQTSEFGMGCLRFSQDDCRLAANSFEGKHRFLEVAEGREYRTVRRGPSVLPVIYRDSKISPDGRWLAVGMNDGFGLWDLHHSSQCEVITGLGQTFSVLFEPSGAVLTNTQGFGTLRWTICADSTCDGCYELDAPVLVIPGGSLCQFASSTSGNVLARAEFAGATIMHLDSSLPVIRVGVGNDIRHLAVSPDGNWVATGAFHFGATRIWDSKSGEQVATLSGSIPSAPVFSPDGQWLATSGDGAHLRRTGSWNDGPILPVVRANRQLGFSPDSTILAVETGLGTIQLLSPETGREFARLDDPNQDASDSLICFSPDGTRLVTTNNSNTSAVHIWDLRMIRRQLSKMGLDWNQPAFADELADNDRFRQPLRLRVDRLAIQRALNEIAKASQP